MINASKLKTLVLAILSAGAIVSCDKRKEAILDYNTPPEIYIIDQTDTPRTELTDSIRISAKFYNIKLRLLDADDNLFRCNVVLDSGKVRGYYQGKEMELPSVRTDQEFVELSLLPVQTGNNEIRFVAEDRFNQTSESKLNLFVFDNLKPVAVFNYRAVSNFEYQFDANNSYDQDSRYGGQVIGYEYTIDGQTFKTPNPIVNHIFPRAGTYTVSLKVLDNDNEYSSAVEEKIIIN